MKWANDWNAFSCPSLTHLLAYFAWPSADGNEGGKHHMIKATVSSGKLWILNIQIGDKRWIRGQDKEAQGVMESFIVA